MIRAGVLAVIRGYQKYLSPLKPPMCRYLPTCSSYAREAITRYGTVRGGWLATKRICRCHPWGGHGYDPVPESDTRSSHAPGNIAPGSHAPGNIAPTEKTAPFSGS